MEKFSAVVDEFQGIVSLLEKTPPLSQGEGLRRAFDRLAAAIEGIPGPSQPARSEAARLIRSRDFDIWVSLVRRDAPAAPVRETLDIAASALTLAAEGPYATPAAKEADTRLRSSVERLDPARPLDKQRPELLGALHDALELLEVIRKAAPTIVLLDAGAH